jgi:hypothetical protein
MGLHRTAAACTLLFTALLAAPLESTAQADCSPIIAALEKASAQSRLAQYSIAAIDAPLGERPLWIRIGKVLYVDAGHTYQTGAYSGEVPVLRRLKRAAADGAAQCAEAGRGTVRDFAAIQYRFEDYDADGSVQQWSVWIGVDSGLPLFNSIENLDSGGFAWVYGDDVADPFVIARLI